MATSLLRFAPLGLLVALVASCVVVEDFEGYGPLPDLTCAAVPCGGAGGACEPFVIEPNVVPGSLTSDAQSLVLIQYDSPGSIRRIPKPGCDVPLVDRGALRPESAVVSYDFLAWTQRGNGDSCLGSNLLFCDPRNCEPQVIPVLGEQPEFEKLATITQDEDFLYYMLTDGLIGRVRKGSTEYEPIWLDTDYDEGVQSALLFGIKWNDGRLYFSRFSLADDVPNSCDDGPKATTGFVYAIDPSLGMGVEEQKLVTNIDYPTSLDVSKEYVFFYAQNFSLLNRVPKTGGAVESFLPSGELVLSDPTTNFVLASFPPVEVDGDWVYFGASTMDGGKAIARLPVGGANWGTQTAEIVVRPTGPFSFVVDEGVLYWHECPMNTECETGRLLGLVLSP